MPKDLVIGLDYGTDSVRTIIVDSATGDELASDVYCYPRWGKGLYCDAAKNQFRQHPADYLDGLKATISNVLQKSPIDTAARWRWISAAIPAGRPAVVHGRPSVLLLAHEIPTPTV